MTARERCDLRIGDHRRHPPEDVPHHAHRPLGAEPREKCTERRPHGSLLDALHDMLPAEQVTRRLAAGEIEIAPLAFMRGRTLAHCFAILDEAQNTTPAQMKMFLTRMGEGSRMVITGDPTQIDLPSHQPSGLVEALGIVAGVEGIGITRFAEQDVVRHPLVARIVAAYGRADDQNRAKKEKNGTGK